MGFPDGVFGTRYAYNIFHFVKDKREFNVKLSALMLN